MNQAFNLTLTEEDYHYTPTIADGLLYFQAQTDAPDRIDPWRASHLGEYDVQYVGDDAYGGAAILTAFSAGWVKHVYTNTTGGTVFLNTLPTFHGEDLINCPTPATVATPTPRLEGLLGVLKQDAWNRGG